MLLVVYASLFFVGVCCLFVFVALFDACCLTIVVCWLLYVDCCLLFVVRCALFNVRFLLLYVVSCG